MENFEQTDSFWKAKLSDEQYYILREKGTERPYTGKLLMNKEKGVYKCAACGNELFTSDMKFDSHCGWPSFDREIAGGKIKTETDFSAGMKRTEIMCAKCGGHLGHIFDDGPTETGQRYCVNSVSLEFLSEDQLAAETNTGNDTIILGGGCFWCVEAIYQNLEGVVSVSSGYAGGSVKNPTYKAVCSGTTGHAEVIEIVFDKAKTSLDEIFKVFFVVHDPTTLNRQGADAGTQYRSTIMYRNENQRTIAKSLIDQLEKEKVYDNPIVTTLEPLSVFYKAEDYHQDYFNNNKNQGYCQMVIQPKIDKFEKIFKDRLKKK
ncbi:MAG: bifunctional methionine sulfoxide reductase B/A protein [Bacteroidetes bacterium]|nr:bifunctional methionine sulfoxide reductase B/A protein [Bacteroidota bacterium]